MTDETLPLFFKAIGDATRLTILRILGMGAYGVLELASILQMKQSGMSHHLKVLASADWVETKREGNTIFYRRSLKDRFALQNRVFQLLDAQPLPAHVSQQQLLIEQERLNAAKTYFIDHADEFELHQEKMVSFEHYGPETLQLLDSFQRPQHNCVLEVGPGKGELLHQLACRFDHVCAIDISPAMLQQAQQSTQHLSNVELFEGNTHSAVLAHRGFDIIIYNMVLHHVPFPEKEMAQCAALLNPNGLLLITDLCYHQQEWARELCGDQWLGFEPEELHQWAFKQGFVRTQTHFLATRNGFQVQMQAYSLNHPTPLHKQ